MLRLDAIDGRSPLATPITIPMPVLAKDLMMEGSALYSLTFWMEVDWRSLAVSDGGGRLSASKP